MEDKQRGGEVEREMLQLWGDKTTEQHLTCGMEEGGHEACGSCTQWHCYKGGVQLIRVGEMDHSLKSSPWEALTQNTPASVYGSLSWRNPASCKSQGSQVVLRPRSD